MTRTPSLSCSLGRAVFTVYLLCRELCISVYFEVLKCILCFSDIKQKTVEFTEFFSIFNGLLYGAREET